MNRYPSQCEICGQPVTDPNLYSIPELGLGFLLGTRCASTSIKRAILTSVRQPDYNPHESEWLLARHTKVKPYLYTYAFVRHPYARVISTWTKLVHQDYWKHMACYGISKGMGFMNFCEAITKVDPIRGDLHLRPLAPLVSAYADEVVKYEHLDEKWPDIASHALIASNALIKLPDLGLSNESLRLVPDGLDAGLRRLERYYRCDFDAFGYSPDARRF